MQHDIRRPSAKITAITTHTLGQSRGFCSMQHALNAKGAMPKLSEDGKFGSLTDSAVRRFQKMHGLSADGIVGPVTWHSLNADGSVKVIMQKALAGSLKGIGGHGGAGGNFCFPLAKRPSPDWQGGARYFGAPRGGGRRHAGCDLLAETGTPIYSIGDGSLVRGPYEFTGPWMNPPLPLTHAVEISYGDVLVRYGEIMPGSYTGGRSPRAGEKIAQVGNLRMLHFELYSSGRSTASLSGGGLYHRRSDITNPAPYLTSWVKNLPGGG